MPVTPFGDDDEGMPDWLQRMLGGVAPGGGVMQYPRSMTGQNMGYPAQQGGGALTGFNGGSPGPAGALAANPGMLAAILSKFGNPFVSSAAAAELPNPSPPVGGDDEINPHGDAPTPVMSPDEIYRRQAQQPPAPLPPNPPAPAPQGGSGYGSMPPGAWGETNPPLPPRRPAATPAATATASPAAPVRTPGAPNLGYGIPNNDRFKTLQYDVAGTPGATQMPGGAGRAGQNRNPYITALNLGSLFGGGQQVNPNAPSPNAAPASAPSRPFDQATINRGAANYPGHWAMSPDQLASYMKTQPWLRNLGGAAAQQMTPDQLAQAVHRPRWWQNV